MDKLDLGWLRVPKDKAETSSGAEKFFEVGSVPMAHGIRNGGKTVSWYHGPLIADKRLSTALEKSC